MARKRQPTVSGQLRKAIVDSDQSLRLIAEKCGVNDAQLSRFMRNERGLTTKTVDRLCEYLDLELRSSKQKGR